ncbi:hypothetical protein O6H91_12G057000 [Diphasiastrum complanatum]|uniref:Uncharacterized protein n=1 Tax=Diphasiastrum complanatum TaxID=34168 RepID=A0ACC2C2C9_DIPCM|nr:hypothetical protein O6H91_12G057000 [Diphasiastrum complanatum]
MERLDSEMHNSGNYFSDSSATPQYESNDEDGNSNGISTQENSKSLDIQTHSLVAKLKLQLTQKNAKIQLLKGAIKQLELNLIKALQSGAGMKLEKNKLLECERTRTRYRQLQHEMASLSDQVLKLKQENERCHVNDHNLNLKVKELWEELERERERAHKISVQLAACRRKEYTQKTIELENSKLNYDNCMSKPTPLVNGFPIDTNLLKYAAVKLDRRFQGAENSAPKPLANACCRVNLPAMHRQKKSNIIKGKTALSGRMGKNHAAKDETEAVLSSELTELT